MWTAAPNIVIEQNLIHNDDLGIELASEHKGHVTSEVIARATMSMYAGNSAGISIGGYGANAAARTTASSSTTRFSTTTPKTPAAAKSRSSSTPPTRVFENNIAYAGAQDLLVNDFTASEPDPATLDYNLYFFGRRANATWHWQKVRYNGYAAYRSATGVDGTRRPSPIRSSASLGKPPDLDLERSSPAIDAGATLGAAVTGRDDFAGRPRTKGGAIDIGAYEH